MPGASAAELQKATLARSASCSPEDGTAYVEVQVTARDRNGNVLFDEKAGHVFQIEDGLIRRFDIAK